jgi:DNA-binding XRE family transcriptional regulator
MLKASLGFMFSHGFRARSQLGHHIAIIEFVRSRIDKKHAGLLTVFDRLRRKRNMALYDDTGFVSHHDAEQALESGRDFISVSAQTLLRGNHDLHSGIGTILHAENAWGRGLQGFDITQADFADRIGVSQSYLSAVERGRNEVGAEVLLAISREFNNSLEWLLAGEE